MMQVQGVPPEHALATQAGASQSTRMSGTGFGAALTHALGGAPPPSPVHTVEPGENLSRICQEYLRAHGAGASLHDIYEAVEKVAQANHLTNPNLIFPGQQIDLSTLNVTQAAAPPTPMAKAAQTVSPPTQAAIPLDPPPFGPLAALVPGTAWPTTGGDARALSASPVPNVAPAAASAHDKPIALAKSDNGGEFQAANAEVAKTLAMVDAVVAHQKGHMPVLNAVQSPWTRLLGAPAHLTSGFGLRRDPLNHRLEHHDGVDLAAPKGTAIHPYEPGQVEFSGWESGYGKVVIVRHNDGLETVYGHCSQTLVHKGDWVNDQTVLARVGSTGHSTGPHLHFEVRRNGVAVNPMPYLESPPPTNVAAAF